MTTEVKSAPKRTWKWALGALVVLALAGGGAAAGAALANPVTSDEYVQLAGAKKAADAKIESLQKDYSTLEGLYLEQKDKAAEQEAAVAGREKAAAEAEKKVAEAQKKVDEAAAAVKKREDAVTGAEKEKAKNTVSDGTWTVGRSIAAGTYVTTENVGSRCYWAILASGTNGSDIIENDIPGGGRPSVTLSNGQDFKTSNCGSWTKQ